MSFVEGEGEQLFVLGIEGGGDRRHALAGQALQVDVQGQQQGLALVAHIRLPGQLLHLGRDVLRGQ